MSGRSVSVVACLLALSLSGLAFDASAKPRKAKAEPPAETSAPAAKPETKQEPTKEAAPKGARVPFGFEEARTAQPEGLPGRLRIDSDDLAGFRAVIGDSEAVRQPWLVLSGGGENGAFAAGMLEGWSQRGDRPAFGTITGVSTGALIAPFAFVGPAADGALKANYTEITAADVFELGGTKAAFTDSWPLKERIEQSVTPDLLKAIAAEHAKGRRLLIATTSVDLERGIVWDMGAIASLAAGPDAARYGDKPLKLFREIVLASTAVPALFPPVMIESVGADGKRFQEMHGDGGAISPFFLVPSSTLTGGGSQCLPAQKVYLVINNRLTSEPWLTPRTILGVLGHTMSAAIKAQTVGAISLTKSYAKRAGIDLELAVIDERFKETSPGPFDPDYMKALFDHGEALIKADTAFVGQDHSDTSSCRSQETAGQDQGSQAQAR